MIRDRVDHSGAGVDDGFGLLPGAVPWPAVGGNGHWAVLHSDLDLVSPVWFRLHLRDGDRVTRVPIPDEVPLWGRCTRWTVSGTGWPCTAGVDCAAA